MAARIKTGDQMTERQIKVHEFMLEFQDRCGFPATMRDISEAMGFKIYNGAQGALRSLLRKGHVVTTAPTKCHRRYVAVRP